MAAKSVELGIITANKADAKKIEKTVSDLAIHFITKEKIGKKPSHIHALTVFVEKSKKWEVMFVEAKEVLPVVQDEPSIRETGYTPGKKGKPGKMMTLAEVSSLPADEAREMYSDAEYDRMPVISSWVKDGQDPFSADPRPHVGKYKGVAK